MNTKTDEGLYEKARKLRVCLSCRSSHSRNGSGNASRTRLLGQDAGLLHSSANCMDGSSLFVLAWPYARGWVARCLPDESRTPGLERAEAHDHPSARVRPVRGTAMPSPGAATPYRSAFICRHVTTSKRFPGNGSSAARSSENRPRSSVSLR